MAVASPARDAMAWHGEDARCMERTQMKRLFHTFNDWWSFLAPKGMEPARASRILGSRAFSTRLTVLTFVINFMGPIVGWLATKMHFAAVSNAKLHQIDYAKSIAQIFVPTLSGIFHWPVILFSTTWAGLFAVYVYYSTERRRVATLRKLGCCIFCGYPISDFPLVRCPECGEEIERPVAARDNGVV